MRWRASGALRRGACLALLTIGATGVEAVAQTETGQLAVSATVLSGCALIGGTLDFGTYISGQEADLDASGQFSFVNCSGTLTFELDGGIQGNVNNRKMSGPDATLAYQIYSDAARRTIWGTGGNAFILPLPAGANPSSGNLTVHGRIPGGQAVPGGSYTDIVNITLNF
jgi:spore coat protein U-like protein